MTGSSQSASGAPLAGPAGARGPKIGARARKARIGGLKQRIWSPEDDRTRHCRCGCDFTHHGWRDFQWRECLLCDDRAKCSRFEPTGLPVIRLKKKTREIPLNFLPKIR